MPGKVRRIAFVGGGTAGHIGKLLAVMQAVQKEAAVQGRAVECTYVGLKADLESPLITGSELPFEKVAISSGKLNRFLTLNQAREFVHFAKGLFEARPLLRKLDLDCIFTNGGYVTVPLAIAAGQLGIPVVTHETDVLPGLANRIIARHAQFICTTYPASYYTSFPAQKIHVTGQPVRPEFYTDVSAQPLEIEGRVIKGPIVTSLGGSQGAHRLNVLLSGTWEQLLERASIIHITGVRDFPDLQQKRLRLPEALQKKLFLLSFSESLAEIFWHSDIVISRAGGTLAELAATRRPAILLPLSTAAQDHQKANAQVFGDAGAAYVFNERVGTSEQLGTMVLELLDSPEKRQRLVKNIGQFDHPHAAQDLARLLLSDSITA